MIMGIDVFAFCCWLVCFCLSIKEGHYMLTAKVKHDKNSEFYEEYIKDRDRTDGYSVFVKNYELISKKYREADRKVPLAVRSYFIVSLTVLLCIVIQFAVSYFGLFDHILGDTAAFIGYCLLPAFLICLSSVTISALTGKAGEHDGELKLMVDNSAEYFLLSASVGMLWLDLRLSATALAILFGKYFFFKRVKLKDIGRNIREYFRSLIFVDTMETVLCRELAVMSMNSFIYVLEYRILTALTKGLYMKVLAVITAMSVLSLLSSYDSGLLKGWNKELTEHKKEVDEWLKQQSDK